MPEEIDQPLRRRYRILGIILTCIAIAVTIRAIWRLEWDGLRFSVPTRDLSSTLTPLVLATAFIERAVEVLISPWRDTTADKLKTAAETARRTAAVAERAIVAEARHDIAPLQAVDTREAAETARAVRLTADDLHEYKGKTRIYAFLISFCFGLAVAMVGMRTLEPILAPGQSDRLLHLGLQGQFFYVVDVILTAALLAGGAAGLHSVINLVVTFCDATKRRLDENAPL